MNVDFHSEGNLTTTWSETCSDKLHSPPYPRRIAILNSNYALVSSKAMNHAARLPLTHQSPPLYVPWTHVLIVFWSWSSVRAKTSAYIHMTTKCLCLWLTDQHKSSVTTSAFGFCRRRDRAGRGPDVREIRAQDVVVLPLLGRLITLVMAAVVVGGGWYKRNTRPPRGCRGGYFLQRRRQSCSHCLYFRKATNCSGIGWWGRRRRRPTRVGCAPTLVGCDRVGHGLLEAGPGHILYVPTQSDAACLCAL